MAYESINYPLSTPSELYKKDETLFNPDVIFHAIDKAREERLKRDELHQIKDIQHKELASGILREDMQNRTSRYVADTGANASRDVANINAASAIAQLEKQRKYLMDDRSLDFEAKQTMLANIQKRIEELTKSNHGKQMDDSFAGEVVSSLNRMNEILRDIKFSDKSQISSINTFHDFINKNSNQFNNSFNYLNKSGEYEEQMRKAEAMYRSMVSKKNDEFWGSDFELTGANGNAIAEGDEQIEYLKSLNLQGIQSMLKQEWVYEYPQLISLLKELEAEQKRKKQFKIF